MAKPDEPAEPAPIVSDITDIGDGFYTAVIDGIPLTIPAVIGNREWELIRQQLPPKSKP